MAATPPDPPQSYTDQSQHGGVRFGDHAQTGPVAGRDFIQEQHIHEAPKSREEIREATNRARMLARVRATWIAGVLDQSLYAATRVELGLREAPEAVAHPWRLVVEQPGKQDQALPPGTPMAQVFDASGGSLLILGAPGAGKTTLLLELARTLVDRAAQDPAQPSPVVFHLASWAEKRPPLAAWLVAELREKYQVPRQVAEAWVRQDQVLPLLDGLDEVAAAHRTACAQAINTYRVEHGLVPLAACCRQAEYAALGATLALDRAVAVQPLTPSQVEEYVVNGGAALAAVRAALATDPDLADLLDTPLMLNVLALAYHGMSLTELEAGGTPTSRRQVFAAYVQKMLTRRSATALYPSAQTQRWLAWLARQMVAHEQSVLYIERMQPDWLSSNKRLSYKWITRLTLGLVGGMGGTLAGAVAGGPVFALALAGAVGFALARALADGSGDSIEPAESVHWFWIAIRQSMRGTLALGLIAAMAFGLGGVMIFGIGGSLASTLAIALAFAMVHGLSTELMNEDNLIKSNQGIWQSARSGLFIGLAVGPAFVLAGGLAGWLSIGLGVGLGYWLIFALLFGWAACIQHIILRFLLWRTGAIPLNYVRFLDYAAERILLRKVGGGYIFVHRLLLDYFAGLEGEAGAAPE